jgi:predicted ferric reductase
MDHESLTDMTPPERGPKYSWGAAVKWLVFATVLALVPLAFALIPPLPGARTLGIEFGVAIGFMGMGLMCIQFLFSGRIAAIAPAFGTDNVLQLHRQVGIVGFILVLAHPVVLILAQREFISYFDPRVNFLRAIALSYVTVAVTTIIVTTLWRETLRLTYEWWRLVHGLLALSIVFTGVVHGIQVGHYLDPLWKKILWAGYAAAAMYLVVHTRVVRPRRARKRPYRISAVEPQPGDVTVLTLEPDGHAGMDYDAGQFAWITIGPSPYSLQQHPFSFVSAANDRRVQFAAKALGDFTSTWKDLKVGTRAYLEGPFGAFTREPHPTMGLFLIVGGIGVTPIMSLLRTLRREGSTLPAVLMYANNDWEEVTFRDEIAELERELNLKVVHVISEPAKDWKGERGLLSREMIARHLPPDPNRFEYFICGPEPLMDVAEKSLNKLGVDWRRIYSERFQIV